MRVLLVVAAGLAVVLVVFCLIGLRPPPSPSSRFDRLGVKLLKKRNDWIDKTGYLFSFLGLASPLIYSHVTSRELDTLWFAGMGVGLMVMFPVAFFGLATLGNGVERWKEFWRFYELKYELSIAAIKWLFLGIVVLGGISIVQLLTNP